MTRLLDNLMKTITIIRELEVRQIHTTAKYFFLTHSFHIFVDYHRYTDGKKIK
jgi:hypothetical protein